MGRIGTIFDRRLWETIAVPESLPGLRFAAATGAMEALPETVMRTKNRSTHCHRDGHFGAGICEWPVESLTMRPA